MKSVLTFHSLVSIIANKFLKSMFAGLDAQLMRDSSFYAIFFGGYEVSCYMFRTYVPSMPEELNYFISGGLAGMFGWTLAWESYDILHI